MLLSSRACLKLCWRRRREQVHEHRLARADAAPHVQPTRRPRVRGLVVTAEDALPPASSKITCHFQLQFLAKPCLTQPPPHLHDITPQPERSVAHALVLNHRCRMLGQPAAQHQASSPA